MRACMNGLRSPPCTRKASCSSDFRTASRRRPVASMRVPRIGPRRRRAATFPRSCDGVLRRALAVAAPALLEQHARQPRVGVERQPAVEVRPDDRVEHEPVGLARMGARVLQRYPGPVADPHQRGLARAERAPQVVQVADRVRRREEAPLRADLLRAAQHRLRREGIERPGALELRALERAGASPALVDHDEAIAAEQRVEAERERPRPRRRCSGPDRPRARSAASRQPDTPAARRPPARATRVRARSDPAARAACRTRTPDQTRTS